MCKEKGRVRGGGLLQLLGPGLGEAAPRTALIIGLPHSPTYSLVVMVEGSGENKEAKEQLKRKRGFEEPWKLDTTFCHS